MTSMVEEVTANTEKLEVEAKNVEVKQEALGVTVEPKTGISFPVELDGKQLNSVGLRKKSILGLSIKVYGFGIYADNQKMKELVKSKIGEAPEKATNELYQVAIDGDVEMMVRMSIIYGGLTMNMVRKNFEEGIGASIKKLNGGQKNEQLSKRLMSDGVDKLKLNTGSVIEITKFPRYILQTKVKDEVMSRVESDLLCRAFFDMYLGDDPFDKEAKENFGKALLSLF